MRKAFDNILNILKRAVLFLFKDLQWKLLSLVLAYIVWLAGTNINDLSQNISYTVPLKFSNIDMLESKDIRVLNMEALENTGIRVNVRALQSVHQIFSTSPEIEATVDFSDVIYSEVLEEAESGPVIKQLSVTVDIGRGGERMSVNPQTVSVRLDKYVWRDFDVQVSELGEVDPEHELISTESTFNTVKISAAQSIVDRIDVVQAQVDLRDAAESFSSTVELAVFDKEKQDITDQLELSVPETTVFANIYPQKEVPLSIGYTGALAYNHVVTKTLITPATVRVIGLPEDLAELDTIELKPLDLTNHNTTLNTSVDITGALDSLKSSIRLKTDEPAEAAVIYTIEPLRPQEFLFQTRDIRIVGSSGLAVRLVNQEPVSITVLGPDSQMNEMTVSKISAQLNLSELDVGEHSVPLNISLPDGMSTVGTPMVDVVITEAPEEFPGGFTGEIVYDGNGDPVSYDPETGLPLETVTDPETGLPAEGSPVDGTGGEAVTGTPNDDPAGFETGPPDSNETGTETPDGDAAGTETLATPGGGSGNGEDVNGSAGGAADGNNSAEADGGAITGGQVTPGQTGEN